MKLFSFIFILLFSPGLYSQDTSGIPVGVFAGDHMSDLFYQQSLTDIGVNVLSIRATQQNQQYLNPYTIIAENADSTNKIHHYTNGIYKKWEAEEDNIDSVTGFKHEIGYSTTYDGAPCWATGIPTQNQRLIYGPHYYQEKKYMRLSYEPYYQEKIEFKVRYRIALYTDPQTPENAEVCSLYVQHKGYFYDSLAIITTPIAQRVLNVSHFPNNHYQPFELTFTYPNSLIPDYTDFGGGEPLSLLSYKDDTSSTGIEFCVDWRGIGQLFVDCVEVMDTIGEELITFSGSIQQDVYNNLQQQFNWNNIKYIYVRDEPHTMDLWEPLNRMENWVNSISQGQKHTITEMYPNWQGKLNGDDHIKKYVALSNPFKLMIDTYPFSVNDQDPMTELWLLGTRFYEAYTEDPNFWYVAQGFGQFTADSIECGWRYPDSSELKSSVMLALLFGAKGIMFWKYDTDNFWYNGANCTDSVNAHGLLVGQIKTPLWYMVKNLTARLVNGELGRTLKKLLFTKDIEILNSTATIEQDYVAFTPNSDSIFCYTGLHQNKAYTDDKYFFIANLKANLELNIEVNKTGSKLNYRFRDIEGSFDTTFLNTIAKDITITSGDGKLFQVAPVLRFGGKLIYNETTGQDTLYDDMIIHNGAVLTVNGIYNAYGNITISNGSIVCGSEGKINFHNGAKLIIDGNISLNPANKLELNFIKTENNSGIVLNAGANLYISNCEIKNAQTGIQALVNAGRLSASGVTFTDCGNYSIQFYGNFGDQPTPSTSEISNCIISGSTEGISASNLPEIVIKENQIYETDLGIILSNISNPFVADNTIGATTLSMPGIMLESCNGIIISNNITGHSTGIHLGNSFPDIGNNYLYENQVHGLYIGTGSIPNLSESSYNDPPDVYPISGFNFITNNGGFASPQTPDNDGSEIYLSSSEILMSYGCNDIVDDRMPNNNPLINTLLLMNGVGSDPFEVYVEGNYWGNIIISQERFGDLTPYFSPISTSCIYEEGSGDGLMISTSTGEIIDTVYPAIKSAGVLSPTAQLYSSADKKFITADYDGAEQIYNQILSGSEPLKTKHRAYKRLLEIGKLKFKSQTYFDDLYNTYSTISQSTENLLMKKVFKQLGTLSLVGQTEYINAIEEFDQVIQANPNTEEAVYAEIDALTIALLVEEDSTRLNKSAAAKYVKKSKGNYFGSIEALLRDNFGGNTKTQEAIIPKEFLLHQNYPNPFNPLTTIRYDIPSSSLVNVTIYDILGREVKALVSNEVKQPGTYEVRFDASGLASGTYFYRLTAGDYTSTKKMMVVK